MSIINLSSKVHLNRKQFLKWHISFADWPSIITKNIHIQIFFITLYVCCYGSIFGIKSEDSHEVEWEAGNREHAFIIHH